MTNFMLVKVQSCLSIQISTRVCPLYHIMLLKNDAKLRTSPGCGDDDVLYLFNDLQVCHDNDDLIFPLTKCKWTRNNRTNMNFPGFASQPMNLELILDLMHHIYQKFVSFGWEC